MKIVLSIALLSQVFLTGCVGLAISIPGPTQIRHVPYSDANFADDSYLPREKESFEEVKRDPIKQEIRYEGERRRKQSCLAYIIVIPVNYLDCGRIETWSYTDPNEITVETHSHRLVGLWCSPLPYWASVALIGMGASNAGSLYIPYFPFCEIHLGTELHVH